MNKQLSLDLEEVKSWVDRNMPQLLDDLIRISRIPSIAEVHGTEYPPFGKACRDVLDETLQIGREYGFQTQNYEYYVGRVSYGDQEEAIGIWSHLDVVETEDGWVYPPYEPTIRDGYMIARGCQDNKSSAAMALHVMRYLKEHQITLRHRIDAYMGTCEEKGMYDLDYYTAHYECPRLSLIPDSGFPVCYGERGSFNGELTARKEAGSTLINMGSDCGLYQIPDHAWAVLADCEAVRAGLTELPEHAEAVLEEGNWKLSCKGIRTNAGNPSGGINALTRLAELLTENNLVSEGDKEVFSLAIDLNHEVHGDSLHVQYEDEWSGPIVLTVTTCRMENRHLVFGFMSKYPIMCNDIKLDELAREAADARGYDLKVTRYSKAICFDPTDPLVTELTALYNEITGRDTKPFIMGGGTYARKLPRAFAFGTGTALPPPPEGLFLPGHGDCHQPDEAIEIERIRQALVVYICAILQIDQMIK